MLRTLMLRRCALVPCCVFWLALTHAWAQGASAAEPASPAHPQLVLIDTDIGDDIDDAFAIALALQSPDLRILGITTTFGDTALRARLLDRMLRETGHLDIPVAAGPPTTTSNPFTQRHYAERSPALSPAATGGGAALDLVSREVRAHPHQITLIALGPLTTVEFLIDRDPASFHLLRRVVMMGGSIRVGYRAPITGAGTAAPAKPEPEWNILNSVSGARKLLASGVPLTLLPLDSTQIPLDDIRRQTIFAAGTPVTDALTLLYHQWGQPTPTLFDPLTVATVVDPSLCPTTPMRLAVDDRGNTLPVPDQIADHAHQTTGRAPIPSAGPPNAAVCLHSERAAFLDQLTTRLTASPTTPPSKPPRE